MGYLPVGAVVTERTGSDGEMELEIQELIRQSEHSRGYVVGGDARGSAASGGLSSPITYRRWRGVAENDDDAAVKGKAKRDPEAQAEAEEKYENRVRDIIIVGEVSD